MENSKIVYEIPKIRAKIKEKAVVLGIFAHVKRNLNLRVLF